jgi:hypothetical protein
MKIALYFENFDAPTLEKAILDPGQSRPSIISTRGSNSAFVFNSGVFHWTKAVKAMCAAMLRASVNSTSERNCGFDPEFCPYLTGASGSLAASIDYALSKEPLWLIDFFGMSETGRSRARQIFSRANPERKRPGPVSILVRSAILPWEYIEVFCDYEASRLSRPRLKVFAQNAEEIWTKDEKLGASRLKKIARYVA